MIFDLALGAAAISSCCSRPQASSAGVSIALMQCMLVASVPRVRVCAHFLRVARFARLRP